MRRFALWLLPWIPAGWDTSTLALRRSVDTFSSGGRRVTFELYGRADTRKEALVILLHGADGPRGHNGVYQRSAADLARNGFAVLLLHYFESTGTERADRNAISRNYLVWLDTISDAISYAHGHPELAGGRIGLLGVSLGASLALTAASREPHVKAVAEVSGAVPPAASAFLEGMPPVLILHGAEDAVVPVGNAVRLEAALKARGVPYEASIYPGQGHLLAGAAARDSGRRIVEFFQRNLRTGSAGAATAE